MTDVARRRNERRLYKALLRRATSGQPFIVEDLWPRFPDLVPGEWRSWVGRQVQLLEEDGLIEFVEWRETPKSLLHSRPVRVWQGRRKAA